jgi:cytochrome P450
MTTSAVPELPILEVLDESFWHDPHAAVRAARAIAPVARTPYGSHVLLSYDDCLAALSDDRLINDYDALLTRNDITDGPLWDWWQLAMLNNNAPVHTRLRSLVSRAFTPRAVNRADELVREHTLARLASAFEAGGKIELVEDLCEPMPLAVICELIGFPRGDVHEFDRWVADLGLMFSERVTPEMRASAEAAMTALGAYVLDHAKRRRDATDAGDDLFASLVSESDSGDRLAPDELVAMIVNLLFGALDTTRGALSMIVALLVGRPDLVAALRRDRSLLPSAIDELLRFEPPVGEITRSAREDLEVFGVTAPAGSFIGLSVLAANRDPARFDEPDDVDLGRYDGGRAPAALSFGRGIHHCLGSSLARLELRAALDVLLDRCASFDLDGPRPRYVPFLRVRRVDALPLVLTPSATAAQ